MPHSEQKLWLIEWSPVQFCILYKNHYCCFRFSLLYINFKNIKITTKWSKKKWKCHKLWENKHKKTTAAAEVNEKDKMISVVDG